MPKPRVLIADDHPILLAGLRKLLEERYDVVGTAADGLDAVEATARLGPELLIIDVSMPRLNGLDAIRRIRQTDRDTRILVLTVHTGPSYLTEALDAGADGYVLKQSVAEELIRAADTVLGGRRYVTPALASSAAGPRSGTMALTPRQREVLQLVAEGHSAKSIAQILNLSVKTVDFHKARIMEQCGLHSTAALVRFAIADGLITAETLNPLPD